MPTDEIVNKLERERRDADARYNAALTAFDEIVASLRGRAASADDLDRVWHTLILFLQQITAFVETKERARDAQMVERIAQLRQGLSDIDELRTRVGMLQRQARAAAPVGGVAASPAAAPVDTTADVVYLGFEDRFRGSDEAVARKLRAYVPIFDGATDVVDLGCGRGEFLDALRTAGIRARGVDANADMVRAAGDRGLDVQHGDAVAYLRQVPDESLGGAIATQVVEHLEPRYLMALLDLLARKLRAGAPLVLETINPACWLAFFSSYVRDFTHVRPIHPETLQYLLRANGFERVELRYSAPVDDDIKLQSVDLPAAVLTSPDLVASTLALVSHTINRNAAILNSLMFTHLDYAAIGYRA